MTIHPHIRQPHEADTVPAGLNPIPVDLSSSAVPQHSEPTHAWVWTGLAVSYRLAAPLVLLAPSLQPEFAEVAKLKVPEPLPLIAPPGLSSSSLAPREDEVWLQPHVRDAIKGPVNLQIYVAGCQGLAKLHTVVGGPVYKIGITEAPSPEERLKDLGAREYGSLYRAGERWMASQGFDAWAAVKPLLDIYPSLASPVVILPMSIGVRLPKGLSVKAFDEALILRLREVAIDRWARLPGVGAQLERNGSSADMAIRATSVSSGGATNAREAAELYFFRKKHEFTCLVAAAEAIVLEAILKGSGGGKSADLH